MFGSVHILPPGIVWMPRALSQALQKGDEVWFEIPVDPATQARAAEALIARSALPCRGQSLRSPVTRPDRPASARLRPIANVTRLPGGHAAMVRRFEPLPSGGCRNPAPSRPMGSNNRFSVSALPAQPGAPWRRQTSRSKCSRAPRCAIRWPPSMRLSRRFPTILAPSAAFSTNGWQATSRRCKRMSWLRSPTTSPDVYRRLITDRNRRWTALLAQRLRGEGEVVVVVGMGHLIGPAGVPALLRAQGFAVTGP